MVNMQWTKQKSVALFVQSIYLLLTISAAVLGDMYLNEWAVELEGGHLHADHVARSLGFINKGQVSSSIIITVVLFSLRITL